MAEELIGEMPLNSRRLISVKELAPILGFSSVKNLRQAIVRKKLPIEFFCVPGRRGRFTRRDWVEQYLNSLEANKM